MRWMAFLIGLVALTKVSHAEPGAVLVAGKGLPHDHSIAQSAAVEAFRVAGWTIVDKPFTDKEAGAVAGCLANTNPSACASRIARDKGA